MKSNPANHKIENQPASVSEAAQGACQAGATGWIASETLFAGKRELLIQHANDSYRLRITNQGKLILTK